MYVCVCVCLWTGVVADSVERIGVLSALVHTKNTAALDGLGVCACAVFMRAPHQSPAVWFRQSWSSLTGDRSEAHCHAYARNACMQVRKLSGAFDIIACANELRMWSIKSRGQWLGSEPLEHRQPPKSKLVRAHFSSRAHCEGCHLDRMLTGLLVPESRRVRPPDAWQAFYQEKCAGKAHKELFKVSMISLFISLSLVEYA